MLGNFQLFLWLRISCICSLAFLCISTFASAQPSRSNSRINFPHGRDQFERLDWSRESKSELLSSLSFVPVNLLTSHRYIRLVVMSCVPANHRRPNFASC